MLDTNTSENVEFPLVMPEAGPSLFHERLRKVTRASHDEVDFMFGQFDLKERGSYGDFLAAHARALVPLEAWLDLDELTPGSAQRSNALRADLSALDRPFIEPAPLNWLRKDADRWGAAYVIEGSRLGGQVLLRSVPSDLPRDYLGSAHQSGAWRDFLGRLDRMAQAEGALWEAEAIASAKRTFSLYADAAEAWGVMRGR